MFTIEYLECNAWHRYDQLPSGRANTFDSTEEAEAEIEYLKVHDAEHEDEEWEYRVRQLV